MMAIIIDNTNIINAIATCMYVDDDDDDDDDDGGDDGGDDDDEEDIKYVYDSY
jgi:hypothetical protein